MYSAMLTVRRWQVRKYVSNIGFIMVHGLNEGHIAPMQSKYVWLLTPDSLHIVHIIGDEVGFPFWMNIRRQLILISSFLFVHPELYLSPIWGMIACNLLPTSLSHCFCHKDEAKGWILIKTSVHGSAGCAFDKKKHLLPNDQQLHFLWYLCDSESNKM